jgi:hypothetical protein
VILCRWLQNVIFAQLSFYISKLLLIACLWA